MRIDLTEPELAYLSRAVFRQRMEKPNDEPFLAAQLDPKLSVARIRENKRTTHIQVRLTLEEKDALVRLAEQRGISISDLVRELVPQ